MYKIIRYYYRSEKKRTIRTGVTLEEAQQHCSDPETNSKTCQKAENIRRTRQYGNWFDGYDECKK